MSPCACTVIRVGVVDVARTGLSTLLALEEVCLTNLPPLARCIRRICSLREEATIEGITNDVVCGVVSIWIVWILHAIVSVKILEKFQAGASAGFEPVPPLTGGSP